MKLIAAMTALIAALALSGCIAADTTTSTSPRPADIRTILVTNDDGWNADGISILAEALARAGYEVTVSAPSQNWSGASMYATGGDLVARQERDDPPTWSVEGTPVDSVRLGITGILESPPDLVVSGTNHGANAAYNVNYSGTVGAATAAAELGVPAIAVSADVGDDEADTDYLAAATTTLALIEALSIAALGEMADGAVVNVNVPQRSADGGEPRGFRTADQARAPWVTQDYSLDPSGRWIVEREAPKVENPDSDVSLLRAGYTTATVLSIARDEVDEETPAVDAVLSRLEQAN